MRRVWLAILLLGCRRDAPSPGPSVVASSTAVAPGVAPSTSASVTRLRVEVRETDAVLADPTSPATPRMAFDVAVGLPGVLRMELVDRVSDLRSMVFDPRDPRCIFIDEMEVTTPQVVPITLTFERREGVLHYVVTTPRAILSGPVAKERLPSGDLAMRAAVITEPLLLTPGHHGVVAGFVWSPRDAGLPDPLLMDEKEAAPHWVFRLRFEPMKTKKP